jgi:hypothetical protein
MKNTEIAKLVLEALRDDKEHDYDVSYDQILEDIDISRSDESKPADIDTIINNCKQAYEA